ncbi:DUF3562 domain-containing protein [Paucibacter sp. Y2R2-4]|uniref:DUF3562 domain-containing protein n=1 Tax=Paucibacter sp. Y2R2-4 TaxID=2893553 RepID=UPI0021E45C63|nr:DUF3562 domain-containing protein [Paucibacter sp. Y2R2-4]MCV2348540.1 DUF3562 domain-containing protein [Paucibacter sp. Y2R2-4]
MATALEESVKQRAIEVLAGEAKLPFGQVARLYEQERSKLELSARIKKFLPIFTFRNVQEQLLHLQPV